MKKHELIKQAYDNYPVGTLFTWQNVTTLESSGIFEFSEYDEDCILDSKGQCVFDGERWPKIITSKPRKKFILKSEDGIDLFHGDEMTGAWFNPIIKEWTLKEFNNAPFVLHSDNLNTEPDEDFPYISSPKTHKAFSTRQAAVKWVNENNKPKYNKVDLFNGMEAHVYSGEILIKDADQTVTTLSPSDIEDLINTYNLLP